MIRVSRTVGFTLCAVVIGLQGCSEIQKAVGNTKQAPDEFAVVARPPLSVPPNFALRPPTPGEPRPQERDVTKSAERLVLGNGSRSTVSGTAGNVPAAAPSTAVSRETPGEAKMRQLLNTASAEPGIRQTVNRETSTFLYEEEYLIDNLLFWREKAPRGVVVDAQAEQKRLQENAALGNEPTAGTTPVIERKRKGLF
ncbi:DUF3035 domain-containing protein [uncultured Nisaea sp.]|uniref:DUF3035 domain-containing protein n=1 Tax=uncultured Nisaea sp. TaxID=538215 RepID=UPI0030EC3CCF|tara:strand:- start:669 stop:1259 length:591 start_codon:yes stop_codon:yes gene_type:complete